MKVDFGVSDIRFLCEDLTMTLSSENYALLLNRCRQFATKNGTQRAKFIGAYLVRDAWVYQDSVVEINVDPLCSRMDIVRVENRNPVVCLDNMGQQYRTHGEFRYVKEHLMKLVGLV